MRTPVTTAHHSVMQPIDFYSRKSDLADHRSFPSVSMEETFSVIRKEERSLIGQELHDNVNQLLMSAKLFLEMLEPDHNTRMIRNKSIEYILQAIGEIRKISHELVNGKAESMSLSECINKMIHDIEFTTTTRISVKCDPRIEALTFERKIAIFRIVQEQLKNIITHSAATTVAIQAGIRKGYATLEIKDNGVGFNSQNHVNGVGLSNIYERARILNGSVMLQTSRGKGCTISVLIPAE